MTKAKSASLKQTKADTKKPSKAITVILPKHIALASEAGKQALGFMTYKDQLASVIDALHKDKIVIGDARKCELAKAFLVSRFENKTPSAAGKAKALGAFRYSVESGKDYDENRERKAKKTKKEKTESETESENQDDMSIDTDSSFVLAIPKKGKADNASAEFRKLINKMKDIEAYSNLAAYLVDALDEHDGE